MNLLKILNICRKYFFLFTIAIYITIGMVLPMAIDSAYAEGLEYRDTNSESSLYLQVGLPNAMSAMHQTLDVLRWKEIGISATFIEVTEDGVATGISLNCDNAERVKWSSDSKNVANYIGNGKLYTFAASDMPVKITCSYIHDDGKTYSASITLNVKKLKVASDVEPLRYAALSHLSYTDIGTQYAGLSVEEMLKPIKAGGRGMPLSDDASILASYAFIETNASYRDFIAAAAADCKFIEQVSSGSFSASVFSCNGKTIIAYRGTSGDLSDFITDAKLGLGLVEADQFPQALALCKRMIQKYGISNVVATGHSLGGGLANFVSLLTGIKAYTFNAPSTIVTAVSNFANSSGSTDLVKNYTGLNDNLRMDYVNERDWVGKVGIGDCSSLVWTGLGNTKKSGNLDRTTFLNQAALNRKDFTGDHHIFRMVDYDPEAETLSLTSQISSTSPTKCALRWRMNDYYFGSTESDEIANLDQITEQKENVYVFGGAGDDRITLYSVSLLEKHHVIGGPGNDIITMEGFCSDFYYYYAGQGQDKITDNSGNDRLYLYGDLSPEFVSNGNILQIIDQNNGGQLIMELEVIQGKGQFEIFLNDKNIKTYTRQSSRHTLLMLMGQVDIEIYNNANELIATIMDGVASSGAGEYGSYRVYCDNTTLTRSASDNYIKVVSITSADYSVRLLGAGDGMLSGLISYETENGSTQEWRLQNIPLYVGARYYPSMYYSDHAIIQCDFDGDGVIDHSPIYTKAESIQLPETIELAFCETLQLSANVLPEIAAPSLLWFSDHPEIVSVDESGCLEAVGIGSANIVCRADDGSNVYATVTVTVAEETLSVNDCLIEGLEERYDYTGEPIDPELTVMFRDKELKENIYYRVYYENDLMPGTASVTITGLSPFDGSVTLEYEIYQYQPATVSEKVEQLAKECINSGVQGDYEIALWMHDWLTHNANYDYTYTEYMPEGVLLKGTGVCQSYTLAYALLLDRMGIDNHVISSTEMDHAWNLVYLNGQWCHVDCTWDDPGLGGSENHNYFGMNDALMSRDHVWNRNAYPACTDLSNYFPIRMRMDCADSLAAMEQILSDRASNQTTNIEIYYIGSDPAFNLRASFEAWFAQNNWRYGLRSYVSRGNDYSIWITISYTEPWDAPENRLDTPVAAPAFEFNSLNGCYQLNNYSQNSLILIFGSEDCLNTRGLIDRLRTDMQTLKQGGIDVLISLDDAYNLPDLLDMSNQYPELTFVCNQSNLLSRYLDAVAYTGTYITYPAVFIINSDLDIIYYSTGWIENIDELMGEAFSTATNNPLPIPGENNYSQGIVGTGSIMGLEGDLPSRLRDLCAESGRLLFITNNYVDTYSLDLMDAWEENYSLYSKLNIGLAVSFDGSTSEDLNALKVSHPHITFIDYGTGDFFWPLLQAAGFENMEAYYLCSYLIDPNGDIDCYLNGDLLSPWNVAVEVVENLDCEFSIPRNLIEIEAEAFLSTSLHTVDLTGGSLRSIGTRAFADCDEMSFILIPNTVYMIADDAFDGCEDLTIFCYAGSEAYEFAQNNDIPYIVK